VNPVELRGTGGADFILSGVDSSFTVYLADGTQAPWWPNNENLKEMNTGSGSTEFGVFGLYLEGLTGSGGLQAGMLSRARLKVDGTLAWSLPEEGNAFVGGTKKFALFQSDDGVLTAYSHVGQRLWTSDAPVADVSRLDDSFLVTQADDASGFDVRSLETGKVERKIDGLEQLPIGPSLSDGDVVVSSKEAVGRVSKNGLSKWSVQAPGARLLAANDRRVLLLGPTRDLVLLDAQSGMQVAVSKRDVRGRLSECGLSDENYPLGDFKMVLACGSGGTYAAIIAV